jgi:hypothetical protein
MAKFFSQELLYRMRNHIPLPLVLEQLGWPHKLRDGRCCFLCPKCSETLTAINPRTNLGRCFRCEVNFNAIDLVLLIQDCDFVTAVHFLEPLLPSSTE